MEEFITDTGQRVLVHNKDDCKPPCCVHKPSEHHMKDWPLYWRSDLGIFERIDPEGVGHPDPDNLDYIEMTNPERVLGLAVHSCNLLCNEEHYKKYLKEKNAQENLYQSI